MLRHQLYYQLLKTIIDRALEKGLRVVISSSNRGYLIDLERDEKRVVRAIGCDLERTIEDALNSLSDIKVSDYTLITNG